MIWGDCNSKVYVPAKGIKRIIASGASDVYNYGTIEADVLYLTVLGAADLILDINAREVILNARGSSDVRLTGNTRILNIDASDSSDVDCKSLKANNVTIDVNGASDMYVNAEETIEIRASGASDIYYGGDPEIKIMAVSGGAEVHRR